MGCDIHVYVEQQDFDGSWSCVPWPHAQPERGTHGPFEWPRDYRAFGFLGNQDPYRNHCRVPAVAALRGLPDDVSRPVRAGFEKWGIDAHSPSWLTVSELADFDYSQTFEDRFSEEAHHLDGQYVNTVPAGAGVTTTFRETLQRAFFDDLAALTAMNQLRPTRIVFWFDN